MILLKNTLILSILFFIYACKIDKKELILKKTNTTIKYARGFDIQNFNNYKKLIIKHSFPDSKEAIKYILVPKGEKTPKSVNGLNIIRTPVEKIVVTSTTHIPMLELLNKENSLVGFPNTQYISSPKTEKLVQEGKIKELGNEQDINTEELLDLHPDIVIGFSLSSNNKMFANIEKLGIPVLLNGDWLEETPLGRAEWIKFFAVLFDKDKEADSIFNSIEKEYHDAAIIAKNAKTRPTVLSGGLYKDIWHVPAGKSFVAQFLKDANTNYLWSDTTGKGSLSLNFETVFDKGQHADIWIAPGPFKTLNQLQNSNQHYAEFDAFKRKNIYSFANKTGMNGGVLYFELSPVMPHIVLKDIIKATHPELLPNYQPYFLEKLN